MVFFSFCWCFFITTGSRWFINYTNFTFIFNRNFNSCSFKSNCINPFSNSKLTIDIDSCSFCYIILDILLCFFISNNNFEPICLLFSFSSCFSNKKKKEMKDCNKIINLTILLCVCFCYSNIKECN